MRGGALTVGDFKAEETNEEEGCNVGEVVALESEVLLKSHHIGVLSCHKLIADHGGLMGACARRCGLR